MDITKGYLLMITGASGAPRLIVNPYDQPDLIAVDEAIAWAQRTVAKVAIDTRTYYTAMLLQDNKLVAQFELKQEMTVKRVEG